MLPGTASAREVLTHDPEGVFLSNGPGDPEPLTYAMETVRGLAQVKKPIFGICLGHQILGLALGGETFKRWYKRLTGGDCGCEDRRAGLNVRYPYGAYP